MSYQEFTDKYFCKTNVLLYYQVISAISKHLLAKAKSTKPINKELYSDSNFSLQLNESINLYLNKIKTSDFYRLLCTKTHTTVHSGPRRWSKDLSLDEDTWEKIFTSLKTICRETKLKEFQYKLIHWIVVTKKELLITDMELRKMMNAYIVVKRTPLTILLEIVISSRFSFNRLSTGSI